MNRDEFYIQCHRENEWECRNPAEDVILMKDEYRKYWDKIERKDNFAFLRYGDGELALMNGCEVTAQEGWHAGSELTELGKSLRSTLQSPSEKMVYGIPCPCCHSQGYYWYLRHLSSANVSFANIWINGNYQQFVKDFTSLKRDAVMITNHEGVGKNYGQLNIVRHFQVSDDCVAFWEQSGKTLIDQISEEVGSRDNLFYAVSAGPLSEVIIWELFKRNPRNCYIDFGSALDIFIHGRVTRPFMLEDTVYAKKNCWMYRPDAMNTDVDVLLTTYKRPEVLQQQLDAVKGQTLLPKRILLYQDGIDSYYSIQLKDDILQQFDAHCISERNGGVWKRFEYGKSAAQSKYVCIFDDDTIPGKRWLENCHMNMMQRRGVYGTNGILLSNLEYPYGGGGIHVGWHSPNEMTREVDFAGHSWFLEAEWLDWMFQQGYQKLFKYVGEDMCLSFSCLRHGIRTYVPAHPVNVPALWGSIPEYGGTYGVNAAAVHKNDDNLLKMNAALKRYHADGWKPIFELDEGYIEAMKFCARREWYSEQPSLEADTESQNGLADALERFQKGREQYDIHSMATALLEMKSAVFFMNMGDSRAKDIVCRFYLRVYFLGAMQAVQQGDHDLALKFFVTIEEVSLALNKREPVELDFYKGLVYYDRQEFMQAEEYFMKYLGYFPRNEEAFFYVGNAAARQNALNRAAEAYNCSLGIKESYKEALHNAECLLSISEKEAGMSLLQDNLEEDSRKQSLSLEGKTISEIPVFLYVEKYTLRLRELMEKLLDEGYGQIYILDDATSSLQLKEWYNEMSKYSSVTVLYLKQELGRKALWSSGVLNILRVNTPYIYVTSAEDIPSGQYSQTVVQTLMDVLRKYPFLTSVGMEEPQDHCSGEYSQIDAVELEKDIYFDSSVNGFRLYRNCNHEDAFCSASIRQGRRVLLI